MRLSDENTREGRHLTPEERIVLQAEEIKQLWQENEQLKAKLDEWKYEAKCHMDEVIAREKQIEQLRARVAMYKEILEQASDALKYAEGYTQYSAEARVREAVAVIDKAIGGKEDV